MADLPTTNKDSVVVLVKAGRLQNWDLLTAEKQQDYVRQHVELILKVGHKYGIQRLEAFRLMGLQQPWHRLWVIEFPTLEGAEEWIQAEMAPPYGSYGYWEYYLARPWGSDYFSSWATQKRRIMPPITNQALHRIPALEVDVATTVVLMFGRRLPGSDLMSIADRGDQEHVDLMKSVARKHDLLRLEGFKLIAPQDAWHLAWIIEFPTIVGAEAWMQAEVKPVYGTYNSKVYHLARNYFCADIDRFKPVL